MDIAEDFYRGFYSKYHGLAFYDRFRLFAYLNNMFGSELERSIFRYIEVSFRLKQRINHDVMDGVRILLRVHLRFEAKLLILPPSLRVFCDNLVDELKLLVLGTLSVKTVLFLEALRDWFRRLTLFGVGGVRRVLLSAHLCEHFRTVILIKRGVHFMIRL